MTMARRHLSIVIIFGIAALLSPCAPAKQVLDGSFLPVEGIVNARDLGGYMTADSLVVKSGLLMRGASLATAKDADLALLSKLHTVKVIDFRTEFEKKGNEDKLLPEATYVSLPVTTADSSDASAKMKSIKSVNISKLIVFAAFNEKAQKRARELYPSLVMRPDCQRQFAAFLREVVDTHDGAVFFHCILGKDRTGFAAAYLLSALGVDRETIIADFDKTNLVYGDEVVKACRKVKSLGGKEEELAVVKVFVGANKDNFIKALDLIDAEYGSMDAYLRGPLGLTDADIETLRARYLTRH